MPKPLFAPLCDVKRPSMTHVCELASRFATSWTSTAIRFVECTKEPCAVVYAEGNRVKWWMRNEFFALSLDRCADHARNPASAEDRVQLASGNAWSTSPEATTVNLREHTIPLRAHNAVLTLLWHPSRTN